MTNYKSNSEFASAIAGFADVLAGFDHLPTLASVSKDGRFDNFDLSVPDLDLITHLGDQAQWACAFGADVNVSRRGGTASVRTTFEMGGFKAEMDTYLYGDRRDAVLGELPELAEDGASVSLSPDQFAELVGQLSGNEELRKWRATRMRHRDLLVGYGVSEQEAVALADRKTVEELGPKPDGVTAQSQEA